MQTTYAHQNETVDALVYRLYGENGSGVVEAIYKNNKNLCKLSAKLPLGTLITLPAKANYNHKNNQTKLWD